MSRRSKSCAAPDPPLDIFQRTTLYGNAPSPRDQGCPHHHRSGYKVALKKVMLHVGSGVKSGVRRETGRE
jgi:hypothetical protein